jgi:hypothetical protein
LLQGSPRPFHVTAPTTRRLRDRPPIRIHRARNLVDADRRLQEGIPVTSPARTYLDLAEVIDARRLPGRLKRGEELEILDVDEVLACCDRSRGHNGAKPLTVALARYRPDARVLRSGLERRFLALVEAAGLPLPATNYAVEGNELDAYWSGADLAVELDSFETHGTHVSFESDRERDAELAEAGITTVRITEGRLDADPEGVVRQLATMLAARPAAAPRRPASPPSPA